MRINYDPEANALYIRFKEDKIEESEEIKEGIIVDYDVNNNPVAIEFLNASRILTDNPEVRIELPKAKVAI
ncbi:MAG: DUF2283 domain-containing protein [bacterium (Candidatus Ratteibacteria) CG_4_10_14_3_um_filter_41_18]|uniref:DUF2283 domain-containing protein n=4 Tax=Candidatus Ratteibacteria TaxID=2979319 RepID=A0A2M7YHG5_9BACT|nr:MAG: DUF2283 domain-containing protein [bacterium (Candidatus Ratteibacteria) CG01_land_8_20_14_3_00_40_19]PIW32640.1 MAG: DUF2283 domain-containing protein [bacterium (Candidatus Ratteibacteria) CG15_BIG_FIL_POST_REV_8_21_14_020_41_12]PIX77472.1 MAG: DUF2283 domain-containing protein [bacterium (Candidatus Ratteibacteria) CG_4_10_14_3_um_filter_41_18]PJA62395.1 MAG: DUF2283 domain-containing protein [bacterium (Candidatus Ratteibacteria) CG_4_9_14_3_um_filter_41_21]HCG77214.1 DUF2283 domain